MDTLIYYLGLAIIGGTFYIAIMTVFGSIKHLDTPFQRFATRILGTVILALPFTLIYSHWSPYNLLWMVPLCLILIPAILGWFGKVFGVNPDWKIEKPE